MYARIRTYYVRPNKFGEKQKQKTPEVRSRDGHVEHVRKISGSVSLKNGVDIGTFVRKTCVFYVVACNYLVLVQDRVFAFCST